MSAPPAHKGEESSSKSQSYAAASKEDEPKRATASEPHDDKDGKVKDGKDKGSHAAKPSKASAKEQHDEQHGKDKGDGSHAAEPSDEPLSTIVQEEKVPEPGFDAPEDKMQGELQAASFHCHAGRSQPTDMEGIPDLMPALGPLTTACVQTSECHGATTAMKSSLRPCAPRSCSLRT